MATSFCPLPKSKSFINLTGQTFGRLTVHGFAGNVGGGRSWHCLCDCGTFTITRGDHMRSGRIISCGCVNNRKHRAKNATVVDATIRAFRYAWHGINARCNRPSSAAYERYGKRGIENRFVSFEAFCECVGPRPSENHSIGRIDNDSHYEPGNVRWENATEQNNNKSDNRTLVIGGVSKTIAQWSREPGAAVDYVIRARIRYGWTARDSVFAPTVLRKR